MLVEFSVVPIGSGSSLSEVVAGVLELVDSSGLPYKINPMGTVVEGEWEEVLPLIKRCHDSAMKRGERVMTHIAIDDRKGKPDRIDRKVKSIEDRLGKTLKK